MEIFKIVKDNKKSLREKSTSIEDIHDEKLTKTLLEMIDYLKNSQDPVWAEKNNVRAGVGLAAPQIGINKDMLAIYFKDENGIEHQYGFMNPRILGESVRLAYLEGGEGCLSVDAEHPGYIYRSYKVTFRAYNVITNKEEERSFNGYEAIIFQHEYDHLKGILFYDHINKKDPFRKNPDAISI